MKRILLLLGLFLCPRIVFSQGTVVAPQTALTVVNGLTRPLSGATITVCAAITFGLPCSPPLTNTLFKDAALTQPLSNPFFADALGNYNFAAAQGTYTVTVTASGFVGYSYQLTVTCAFGSTCVSTSANNTFTGNNSHTGSETFKTINNTQLCDQYPGADVGAKINACIAALPSTGGIADARGFQGAQTVSTAVSVGNTAGTKQVGLLLGVATFVTSQAFTVYKSSFIVGLPAAHGTGNGGVSPATIIQQANTSNLNAVIQCGDGINSGSNCVVQDLQIDANNANNPSTVYALLANKSSRVEWFRVSIKNSALHGFGLVSSTNGNEACCAQVYSSISLNNTGSGLFIKDSSDLRVWGGTEFENNARYGIECQSCGGIRIEGADDFGGNTLGGISLINDPSNLAGTTGSFIEGAQFGNNNGHDIQITGTAVIPLNGTTIQGNNFIGSTSRTDNTYDPINIVGSQGNAITGNHIGNSASPHRYRNGLTISAGGSGGDGINLVGDNIFDTSLAPFGTAFWAITANTQIADTNTAASPVISSGFGTGPAVTTGISPWAFTINVGTGGVANSGVVAMGVPAPNGWNCSVNDLTATSTNQAYNTVQTGTTTTLVNVQNQTKSTGAAVAWAASDTLQLSCVTR